MHLYLGGKILALSSATALAAPFENIFFEGNALNSAADVNESLSQNVLAWSGMRYVQVISSQPQMSTFVDAEATKL